MLKWIRKLMGIRYVWVRSQCTFHVRRLRAYRDPFGDFVMLPLGSNKTRVELNADGTTKFSMWPEWREGRGDGG